MQYRYCSLRDVVGRVIRNTRLQDSSYIGDLHEWLYEAMELLHTQQSLKGCWEEIKVRFHKAKLPCGLIWLDAVEYNGKRLSESRELRPSSKALSLPSADQSISVFQSSVKQLETIENHIVYTTELTKIEGLNRNEREYYYTELGAINTSFADGVVTLYYRAVPADSDGLPLIPDNQNYKQAIYWYVRAMLIGSGWPDKQFSYEYCHSQFELYGARAIAEITYPSPDQMERRVNNLVRLVPAAGYYESFFADQGPERPYNL